MQSKASPFYQFRDLLQEAGVGSGTWSRWSYLAATYYHYIIAIFTAGILFLVLIRHDWPLTLAATGLYVLYVILRKTLIRGEIERRFYQADYQYIRAQLGLLAITVLIILTPGGENTALWVLYLLMVLLASKHCSTMRMSSIAIEASLALGVVRLWHGVPLGEVLLDPNWWADCLVLGLLSFILHYLVRNIQARNETIAAHNAVNALAEKADMTDVTGSKQWQPMLLALLKHLGAACASVSMCDYKTGQLRSVASVRRSTEKSDALDWEDSTNDTPISLDSPTLIAEVARTGKAAHVLAPSSKGKLESDLPSRMKCEPTCSDFCAELAVPINVGTSQHEFTLGVLSVGFRRGSFHERLLIQYQNFMRGLVSQAKPMLAYAQRLLELVELQEASRQVWRSFDLDQVLDSILQALVARLGFEFALISLVDDDRRVIHAVRGLNVPQKWIDMAVHPLDSNDIQADIVRTRKTEVIDGWDDRFDRRIWNEFKHAEMVRVFVPVEAVDALTRQERVIATIEAGYRKTDRNTITPDQKRMLEGFQNQVCMAIEHARLLQRTRRKADVLTSLHSVGQAIASAEQPGQVLEQIAERAKHLLTADIVMLYRYHPDTHSVDQPVTCGEIRRKYRLNLDLNGDNILTHLLRKTQPYYSSEAHHDPLLAVHASGEDREMPGTKATFIQHHNIKSFAGIPLVADGETVGTMLVNYRKRHSFDPDERQVHELFAQQAAVAIKNAESNDLARDLIVREERNRLSRELHHSVSQALFGIMLKAQKATTRVCPDDEEARSELCDIIDIAHVASNETGYMIEELRAPMEESRYLAHGLEEYTQRITRWYGLQIALELDLRHPLAFQHEQILVRFAREAINNAVRHAHCTQIRVCCESQDHCVRVGVQDDGVGFDPTRIQSNKLGLKSMQELAKSVGGNLSISSVLGAGTTASLHIPLNNSVEE